MSDRIILTFSCSGAADIGEIADRTARKLTREGAGKMYCMTGVGGGIESIVKNALAADTILAIDGCRVGCASHCLTRAGITRFKHLQLTDIGMDKDITPATDEAIARAANAAMPLLAS